MCLYPAAPHATLGWWLPTCPGSSTREVKRTRDLARRHGADLTKAHLRDHPLKAGTLDPGRLRYVDRLPASTAPRRRIFLTIYATLLRHLRIGGSLFVAPLRKHAEFYHAASRGAADGPGKEYRPPQRYPHPKAGMIRCVRSQDLMCLENSLIPALPAGATGCPPS